jgi:hypothetical protein
MLVKHQDNLGEEQHLDQISENLCPEEVAMQDIDPAFSDNAAQLDERRDRKTRGRAFDIYVWVLDRNGVWRASQAIQIKVLIRSA